MSREHELSEDRLAHKRALRRSSPKERERLIAERAERKAAEKREATERLNAERLAILTEVVEEGGTVVDVAERTGLLPSGVVNWAGRVGIRHTPLWKRLDQTGYIHPSSGKRRPTVDPDGNPIDPADLPPTPQERRQARLDDIEWMVSWGASDVEVSARTGQSLRTLERYLGRNGRWDLWSKMSRYRGLATENDREGVSA